MTIQKTRTGKIKTASDLIKEALPELLIGYHTTTFHAIHEEYFVGELAECIDFKKDVRVTCRGVD
jgi:hypothetical protein